MVASYFLHHDLTFSPDSTLDSSMVASQTTFLKVDVVVIEVEDNVLSARTATSLATPMIVAISYMVDLYALLI